MNQAASPTSRLPALRTSADARRIGLALLLTAAFLWSYWPTLVDLWRIWQGNADYSAGQFVPLIAAWIIWTRRDRLRQIPLRTCWWGLLLLVGSQLLRLAAVLLSYGSFEQYSIVPAVVGASMLLFGWGVTWRLAWVFAFLLLMVPLPRRVHAMVALPLQDFATASAVFCLELLGHLVTRQGNVLVLGENNALSVAEACSGLRMLAAFVVVGATMAFLVRRPLWQKAVLVAATLPIAVLANTARLTATALVAGRWGAEASDKFFHDYAGVMMMPFAFAVLVLVLRIMGPPPRREPAAPARPARGPAGPAAPLQAPV